SPPLPPFGHVIRKLGNSLAHPFGVIGRANAQNALRFVPRKRRKARYLKISMNYNISNSGGYKSPRTVRFLFQAVI
ncbi:hypothetical protein, partial [Aggregatibacter actinomycetemcomitans]|uniref:hypothetical protein n=1 Tax=Aggregatibacter actinomycetemcomitans TaxID=714 RepID=UPI001C3FF234